MLNKAFDTCETSPQSTGGLKREGLIVLFVSIIATLILHLIKHPPRMPYADEFEYLGVAFGIFQFGIFGQVTNPDIAPSSQAFFPPLYPAFLALLMKLDATFAASVQCILSNMQIGQDHAFTVKDCAPNYGFAVWVQVGLEALTPFFVWGTARRLSGSMVIAVLAAMAAGAAKHYDYYADMFLTENLTLPLAAAFGWAWVAMWQEQRVKPAMIAGALFALLVLVRAGWPYALLVMVPLMALGGVRSWRAQGMRAFAPLMAFMAIYGVLLTPWLARNQVQFKALSLTINYAPLALLHRVSYNHMTNSEFASAFIYWIPNYGEKLVRVLNIKRENYERLDFFAENGFYRGERYRLQNEMEAQRGDQDPLSYLLEHEVLGNFGRHTLVTLAMTWRGMFVAQKWGVIAWLFFAPVLVFALYRRWGAFLVLALPMLFMLGLNAFVSVSIGRYNLPLIPVMAFSVSYLGVNILRFGYAHWTEARARQ